MTAVDLDAAAAAGPSARDRFSARDQIGKVMGDGGGDRLRARRDAILAFLVRCVSAALLYLTQVVMARWMGASEYGIYVTVWTAVIMLGGVTSLGLNLGVMRLVSVHREAGDMAALRGLMLGSRAIAVVMAVGFVMAGYAGLAVVQMSDGHRAAASIALLCLPLLAMTDMQDGIGRGHGWMMPALVPPYVLRPLLLLGAMSVAVALGHPMVAATAAMAVVAAVVATALVQAVWLNRKLANELAGGPRRYPVRLWIASSLPLLGIAGAELALQNTDIMVLSRFAAPSEVAMYFAAGKTMSLIMFVHYAVGSAMASRFAGLKERGDTAGLRIAVRDAVTWTFWPSALAAALILIAGKPLLSLFGPGFSDGYPIMAILVIGLLVRSSTGPAEILLNMMGEQRICAAVMTGGAVIGLVMNLALVPVWGATGAAIGTATALASVGIMNAYVVRSRLGFDVAFWRVRG
jgi:O-antigen/teichoic acid export membrane protein